MTDISTGTLTTSGTTTYIVGTSSGIDTSALVEIAVAEITADADLIDIKVDENDTKIAAYEELETLATAVQTSLSTLMGTGTYLTESNIFDTLTGTLSASDGSTATSYVEVAIDSTATVGSYEIEIQQTAEAAKISSDAVTDSSAELGYTGSFTLGLSDGSTEQIDVTSTTTLQDLSDAINAVSDTTGIDASIIQVSETEYQLILTAQDTNQEIEISTVSGDDIMTSIGVTDGVGGFENELQEPQGSIVVLDGITITRDDNDLDDVLTGVEFSLVSAAVGTTITLDIDSDASSVKDAITTFIESYNELRTFVLQNQEVGTDGTLGDDAILFSDTILESLSSQISTLISADYSSNSSTTPTLRDLGITFDDYNNLEISDEDALDTFLLDNLEDVQNFFASSVTDDSDDLALLTNTSTLASQDFTLDITYSGSAITSVSVDGDSSLFTFDGTRITGTDGSLYEGLVFSYQGTESTSVEVSLNQGFANLLDSTIDAYANDVDGVIVQEKASLQSQNESLSEEATEIRAEAEEVRTSEIERYAIMEAEINALGLLLDQIRAILGSDDD